MFLAKTIAALATAPAPAGIAVVRISGPETSEIVEKICRGKRSPLEHPREMILTGLVDPRNGGALDHGLVVFMPGPNSFTGEDTAEFHLHGSLLIVQKLLRSLYALGAVAAAPGEFTQRAFLNGKLDLLQAEAVADMINATSEQALKLAGEQLEGRFSSAIVELGEPLRDLLAEIEANIDFPEEDITPETIEVLKVKLKDAQRKIERLLVTYNYGHTVREGFRVLLCGPPNVGKSSLLNALLGTERAIVTDVSGTTRDLIEEATIINGYRFVLCDSAGITQTSDKVEQIGIELAIEKIDWADVIICVADASDPASDWRKVLEIVRARHNRTGNNHIWLVVNKIDLNPQAIGEVYCERSVCSRNFYLSTITGAGLDSLQEALVEEVRNRLVHNSVNQAEANMIVTNERQRGCLLSAQEALAKALEAAKSNLPLEFISAELRLALSALEEIVGKTYNEDILGRIFSKFCIGK